MSRGGLQLNPLSEWVKKPVFWAGLLVCSVSSYALVRHFSSKRKDYGSALRSDAFVSLRLHSVEPLSHNTARFRFAFPHAEQLPGYHVASCLLVKATLGVKDPKTGVKTVQDVIRPYTPTSSPEQRGFLDLVVKRYPNGPMSEHIFSLKPGDRLDFKGPIPKLPYETNKWKHIGMVAGGTGITPMLQVVHRSLSDAQDKTRINLLFGNVTPDDILLKPELDQLAKRYPDRFKVSYTLDRPVPGWPGFSGFVTAEMLQKAGMPSADQDGVIMMVCGSDGMLKHVCGLKNPDKSQGEVGKDSLLGKLGFKKEQVFKF